MTRRASLPRRVRNAGAITGAVVLVALVNARPVAAVTSEVIDDYRTSRPEYIAEFGDWQVLELPEELREAHHGSSSPDINAIHAALLPTGKILVIAGSGNDAAQFEAGTYRTLLWDPATSETTEVETPEDLFCAGHAYLPNGNLLVAGGTRSYEVLAEDVTHAAGGMTVKNESPDEGLTLPEGTVFASEAGLRYRSAAEIAVPPAQKVVAKDGTTTVTASETRVWVEAVEEGETSVVTEGGGYTVEALRGAAARNVYGTADKITLEKQEYQGLDASWEFDPYQERYLETGRLNESRWYPTLIGVEGGDVLAVSGLDEFGVVLEGQNELFSRESRQWVEQPQLERYFPTYPALFRMADERLFYSGSNAGYGPAEEGRAPGVWDLTDNSFTPVAGLRDPHMTETSSSLLLPPAQDQKVMIMGGGGVGDSSETSVRTDVIDLDAEQPQYTPGPDLPVAARYLSTVVLPDDTVLTTGGSWDYRGRNGSDILAANFYHPDTNTFTPAAAPEVGRGYHSEALLLPDGRVVTLGSDPLYGNAENDVPGTFEQRIEIYSPPYLSDGDRPEIASAPERAERGSAIEVTTPDAGRVARARLIRPSAVTHVTDTEQRSIELGVTAGQGSVSLAVPEGEGLVPSGWYMLFLLDADGTPSVGSWIQVP